MDTGVLAQMSFSHFNPGLAQANGYAARGKTGNSKHLSVALPSRVGSIDESHAKTSSPRPTNRSHLLAGLRTAPKSTTLSYPAQGQPLGSNQQWTGPSLGTYSQAMQAMQLGADFTAAQYAMQAAQQTYALPEQVLAPPTLSEEMDDVDPHVLEQLQMTGLYLAQRQQQLQQQLANITAAANQFQGLDLGISQQQQQQHLSMANLVQQAPDPIPVPGQPGIYVVQNPLTGEYQYVQLNAQQYAHNFNASPVVRVDQTHNMPAPALDAQSPVFRAEVAPPVTNKPAARAARSFSPPVRGKPQSSFLTHVEPLPAPSANAFRPGHRKTPSSLSLANVNGVNAGPKTASAAIFGSSRACNPPTPMTGSFGPGAARAGAHPVRQPRGPPPLEELVSLPTANHEGSKNFAARRRRQALSSLVRAGGARRGASNPTWSSSPTSDDGMSLAASLDDEPGLYRRQSPIGSERSNKRASQSSIDESASDSTAQTPATEDLEAFDMQSFVKQLPAHVQQGHDRRRMMLGVLSAAEKRKSNLH